MDFLRKIKNFKQSINSIGQNLVLEHEIIEMLVNSIGKIDPKEISIDLPYQQTLKVYGAYTKDQIL